MSQENVAPEIPEYELSSYEPVEFSMPSTEIPQEQVRLRMQQYAEQFGTEYIPTNRKIVGPGETVKMDIEILRDGEPVPNLSSDDRLFTLDEGLMPPEFEAQLAGMNVGDTKEFDFNAPDYEGEEAIERSFHAVVTINKIMRKTVAEISDAFVKKYMPMYGNVEEFEKRVREEMASQVEQMAEQERLQRAAAALAERFDGKIDDFWYDQMRAELYGQLDAQAQQQGMSRQDFVKAQGMDENQFNMMMMLQVRQMLTQSFSLDAWARHYGLEVGDQEIRQVCAMMAGQNAPQVFDHAKENPQEWEALERSALRFAANRDLVEKAKITYVDATVPEGYSQN